MLVLSRKKGESLMIGDNIELVVISTEGDTVKLGIKAPRSVSIHRKEVYEEIQQMNQEATKTVVSPNQLGKLFQKPKN